MADIPNYNTATARNFSDDQIDRLAEYLRGTCKSLTQALQELWDKEEDDMTLADCQALDSEVFECTQCGWWDTIDQMADDPEAGNGSDLICQECDNENNPERDDG